MTFTLTSFDDCFDVLAGVSVRAGELVWCEVTEQLNIYGQYQDLTSRFDQTKSLELAIEQMQMKALALAVSNAGQAATPTSPSRNGGEMTDFFEEHRKRMLRDHISTAQNESALKALKTVTDRLRVYACAFHHPLAGRLEAVLSCFSRGDFGSNDRNREAIIAVGEALQAIGMCLADPKTGKPARATFKPDGRDSSKGRFVFEYYEDGKRKVGYTGRKLPKLELVPGPTHQSYFAEMGELLYMQKSKRAA